MKRRWFAVMGGTVVLLDAYFVIEVATPGGSAAVSALIGLGGLLLLLGGVDPLPAAVPWYQFVGAGVIAFGAVFIVAWTVPVLEGAASGPDYLLAVAGIGNSIVLGLVGLDWLRGGGFFDLSVYEPGPIFGDGADAE